MEHFVIGSLGHDFHLGFASLESVRVETRCGDGNFRSGFHALLHDDARLLNRSGSGVSSGFDRRGGFGLSSGFEHGLATCGDVQYGFRRFRSVTDCVDIARRRSGARQCPEPLRSDDSETDLRRVFRKEFRLLFRREFGDFDAFPLPIRHGVHNDGTVAIEGFVGGDGDGFPGDIYDCTDTFRFFDRVLQKRIRTFVYELGCSDADEFARSDENVFYSLRRGNRTFYRAFLRSGNDSRKKSFRLRIGFYGVGHRFGVLRGDLFGKFRLGR